MTAVQLDASVNGPWTKITLGVQACSNGVCDFFTVSTAGERKTAQRAKPGVSPSRHGWARGVD
jgi:hypothetical protein